MSNGIQTVAGTIRVSDQRAAEIERNAREREDGDERLMAELAKHYDVHAHLAEQRRTYGIGLQHNLSRWAIYPWWATMTHGAGIFNELIFRAHTREKLIAKCERFAYRNARKAGIAGELTITIREPLS